MEISKIKLIWKAMTSGTTGVVEYLLEEFNSQVLQKIQNKETALMYINDIKALSACGNEILDNHANNMSAGKERLIKAIIDALDSFASSVEDFNIESNEFTAIYEKLKIALQEYKNSNE